MKILKTSYVRYFLLLVFTLSIGSCALKKNSTSNKNVTINKNKDDNFSKKNILYLVDGKEVAAELINTIATNNIESVTVIKGDKDVAKYTDKKYDGVIIIKMKKKL